MIRYALSFVVWFGIIGTCPGQNPAPPISETTLRNAVVKPLALIQKSQKVWQQTQTCFSCHHQAMPTLMFAEVEERRIPGQPAPFDPAFALAEAMKSVAYLKDLDAIVQGVKYIDEVDEAWRLVAANAAGVAGNVSTAAAALFLASAQRADGSWFTMDARPPQSYCRVTTTALCARAVQLYLPPKRIAQRDAVLKKARVWLSTVTLQSTEERTFQLLGLFWTGAEANDLAKAADALVAERRADGGWGQLPGRASDAYSTGQVLYALAVATRRPTADPVYQAGLQFLLGSQKPDGSWRVATRLHADLPVSPGNFDADFPARQLPGERDQFVSIMGTAWAVRAILQAVPVTAGAKAATVPAADVTPAGLPPWVDTVLTGTAADLKAALTNGMSENAATPAGTTALMLAAYDPELVKILLDAKANVDAKATSNATALIVASRHHGNTETIRALLAKGANPNVSGVKNQMSALFFAATSGNVDSAKLLLDAGAAVDAEMRVLGTGRQTPLIAATRRGDRAMADLMLNSKANINGVGKDNISPLHVAVIGHHPELVGRLLALKANVNLPDDEGFTPLHYAAMVDYEDTTVMKLLLAAGAKPTTQTKAGKTPLDLAREMKHAAAAAVLAEP